MTWIGYKRFKREPHGPMGSQLLDSFNSIEGGEQRVYIIVKQSESDLGTTTSAQVELDTFMIKCPL